MNSLHLILALPARADQLLEIALQAAPSLIALLRRGEPAAHEAGLSATLCRACGITAQQDWPLAPVCAAAEGQPVTPNRYWLRLDPVHLEVAMGGLILRPPESLALTRTEADALIDAINLHWLPEHLALYAAHPARWYLPLPEVPILHTTPLDQMVGEYLTPHLPRGADARRFLHLINEVQMLLHMHPVNQAREAAGLPLVNGLWLWGGGRLPVLESRFDLIAGDSFEMQALAHQAGILMTPQPKALTDLQHCDRALVALTQAATEEDGDPGARLAQLEQNWFHPLLRQLQQGRIRQVRLDLVGHRAVTLTPWQSWRFWR